MAALRRDTTAGKGTQEELLCEFSDGKDKAALDAFRAGIAEFAKEASTFAGRSHGGAPLNDGEHDPSDIVVEIKSVRIEQSSGVQQVG